MAATTMHIIVGVDDDFRSRESLQCLLESAGFKAYLFLSAEAFLLSGKLAEASCLITDFRMPEIDGIELQRRVRRERLDLPVIFISGHHNEEIERKALQGGASNFIYKPFDDRELLAAVNRAISKCPGG